MLRRLTAAAVCVTTIVVASSQQVRAQPCIPPDGPYCMVPPTDCFKDDGDWNPSGFGRNIQETALQTLGTRESCVPNGGKAYYQMQLGANSPAQAQGAAIISAILGNQVPNALIRQAWCSEAVSYWHREARIPYDSGYRSTEYLSWRVPGTYTMRQYYEKEEELIEEGSDGRGRWIDAYSFEQLLSFTGDFEPGVNGPAPGSYIAIRKWIDADGQHRFCSYQNEDDPDCVTHSLMINEMTIYRDREGKVQRIAVTLLEGNTGIGIVAKTRTWDDLFALLPNQPDFIDSHRRKIVGFGVDLDGSGDPIFDRSRLHEIPTDLGYSPPGYELVAPIDPEWEEHYAPLVPKLVEYAKTVRSLGIGVSSSLGSLQFSGVPDGHQTHWSFSDSDPSLTKQGAQITIDLRAAHPLPIQGLVLAWQQAVPTSFNVQWAGTDEIFHEALLPKGLNVNQFFDEHVKSRLLIPAVFDEEGVDVRYVRIIIPPNAIQKSALLSEIEFLYDSGPDKDSDPSTKP